MRLSEAAIIYLASAAPVGVVYFLRHSHRGARRAHSVARALAAALLWPLTLVLLLLEGRRSAARRRDVSHEDARASVEERVEETKASLLSSLRRVEEILSEACGAGDVGARRASFAARESVERYAGLSLAAAGAGESATPSAREMELCRIAGRSGDDLLLAGRCVHRNNLTRLAAHRERARAELLQALAHVREARPTSRLDSVASVAARDLRLSEALLQTYARAVEMCSALDDRRAALGVARLLDAECARLRRLEAPDLKGALRGAPGEESCTPQPTTHPHAPPTHTTHAAPLLPQTTSTRG